MSDPIIHVRDETRMNSRLAAELRRILTEAAPHLHRVTGMETPPLTVRLMSPREWQAETGSYVRRSLIASFAGPDPSPDERAEAEQIEESSRRELRLTWLLRGGLTVTTADGEPQTIISPPALRHTGHRRNRPALQRLVIRESVRQCQIALSRGAVIPPPVRVRSSKLDDRAVLSLIEGHADWAAALITDALGRRPVDTPLQPSRRHRAREEKVQHAQASGHFRQTSVVPHLLLTRETAAKFVAEAVAGAGNVHRFNRVFTKLALVPTAVEIANPSQWLRRAGFGPSRMNIPSP